MKLKRKKISFKRSGKRISFLRKPRKKLRRPKLRVSKKVYKRRTLRNPYGEFAGTKSIRR